MYADVRALAQQRFTNSKHLENGYALQLAQLQQTLLIQILMVGTLNVYAIQDSLHLLQLCQTY